jgi:hypothetical protein
MNAPDADAVNALLAESVRPRRRPTAAAAPVRRPGLSRLLVER